MVKATETRLVASERFFDLVFESHKFFIPILFWCTFISKNRWTKTFDQGSMNGLVVEDMVIVKRRLTTSLSKDVNILIFRYFSIVLFMILCWKYYSTLELAHCSRYVFFSLSWRCQLIFSSENKEENMASKIS